MPIIGNTLPARTDLTKAQKIAVAKGRIVARVNNLLAQIKASEEAAWKDIWESPDYGPAEILAAFGTDAAELFQISNQVQLLLETLKPGTLDPKVLSAGAPYTLNADGTVTLNA